MIKKENTGSLTIEINPEFQEALDLILVRICSNQKKG